MRRTQILATLAGLLAFSGMAQAGSESFSVPRGEDIRAIAGACPVGPFGQTSKAGEYNSYCHTLTESEICLAHIKGHMKRDRELNASHHPEKTEYCLDSFRQSLLGAE